MSYAPPLVAIPITITEREMDQAREELIERLLDGKSAGRVTFHDVLDCALNDNQVTVHEVAQHLLGITDPSMDEHTELERHEALRKWMKPLAERWVDAHPEDIRERAAAIAADEGDDQ